MDLFAMKVSSGKLSRMLFVLIALSFTVSMAASEPVSADGQIIKTGYNIGPLPAIAYDADKGFQVGAVLQLFNYGDGSNYPNYNSKVYLEASYFTKGSQLYQIRYDNRQLFPGVRMSAVFRANLDKAFDFYGFNGYQSYYDHEMIAAGKNGEGYIFSPFYRMQRREFLTKADFTGKISGGLNWEAGLFATYHKMGEIDKPNVNKGKSDSQAFPEDVPTLLGLYRDMGMITEDEFSGGFSGGLRLGMVYDTRNKEGAPSSGIWAEGHVSLAPGFISHIPFYRYSFTWRHYVPLVSNDILTFAYRLNYEGTFGNNAPYYVLGYLTKMGEMPDIEGMGGFHTVRGLMRSRVLGLDMAEYNAEFRWRFARFHIGRQNIALALNFFSDGAVVTRGRKMPESAETPALSPVSIFGSEKDTPHITFGSGFRFIMNENFIVAAEYGTPLTHFMKNSPLYNQDGTGAFYVNVGYLF